MKVLILGLAASRMHFSFRFFQLLSEMFDFIQKIVLILLHLFH